MPEHDRVALVTGANKGIDYEIAFKLGKKGIIVYVGTRNSERGNAAANKLITAGIDARYLPVDLCDSLSIKDAAHYINEHHGYLDILVNNAGTIDPEDGSAEKSTLAAVRRTFETNFFGTLELTKAMLPLLRNAPAARIVNLSSGLGSLSLNEDPAWEFADIKSIGYNASKAALNMLTVQLAWELRDTNIKVNATNPNFTDTDLVPSAVGGRPIKDVARTAIELALLDERGPTGGFYEVGLTLPW